MVACPKIIQFVHISQVVSKHKPPLPPLKKKIFVLEKKSFEIFLFF